MKVDLFGAEVLIALASTRLQLREQRRECSQPRGADIRACLIGFYQPEVVAEAALHGASQRQLDPRASILRRDASQVRVLTLGSLCAWSCSALARVNGPRRAEGVSGRTLDLPPTVQTEG